MSNTEDLYEKKSFEQEEVLQMQPLTAKLLYRQYPKQLIALLLTIIVAITLTFILFYQQSERSRVLIDNELTPVKQQFEQLQALQKAKYLVNELLFIDNGKKFVELQTELITVNKQLLALESSNTDLYQQWLDANTSASDIVINIQKNHGLNEQLKQNSLIQLQSTLFSITPIINTKTTQQALFLKQLQSDRVNGELILTRANANISAIQQLHNLKQLKRLLTETLSRFELLTIHTSIREFDLLRSGVEQIITLGKTLKIDQKNKAMVNFNQQIDTLEEIALTQQKALLTWKSYISLVQSYQLDLTKQNNKLIQILAEPQGEITDQPSNMVNDWFESNIPQEALSIALLLAINLSVFVFCYLLWRLREQIKAAENASVILIDQSIQAENGNDIQANGARTHEVIQQADSLAKPAHNEKQFQNLLQQCRADQQAIDEQARALDGNIKKSNKQQQTIDEQARALNVHINKSNKQQLTIEEQARALDENIKKSNKQQQTIDEQARALGGNTQKANQQQLIIDEQARELNGYTQNTSQQQLTIDEQAKVLDVHIQNSSQQQLTIDEQAQALDVYVQKANQQLSASEEISLHLKGELQRYKYLENEVVSFIQQQQQAKLVNQPINNETNSIVQFPSLIPVYEQLKQFYLASDICLENTVLTLTDVNLIDEIHAILMNKQAEQKKLKNQLYFSYDDQLLVKATLDFRLFQQLINLLIDVVLRDCQNTQLHLHLQLKNKSAGQQLVHFVVSVKGESIDGLPDLVTLLIDSQTAVLHKSPLVGMLNTLFVKQRAENITAQLIDNGFQFDFELPLPIAYLPVQKKKQESILDGTKVMLLSRNGMLADLLGEFIHSTWAQFEVSARIGSFNHLFTAKRLSKNKIDLLIVASDIAQTSISLIIKQLDSLPTSLQPKLMLLQSEELNCDGFGFYSQTEQLLFKDVFLQNVNKLLVGEATTNQLFSPEQCQQSHYLASELPVLLAVHSPQQYQNFQRLLYWLGLEVHVVSHADAQLELWKTGIYCILFTEFSDTSLLKMENKPLLDIGVFSLTDDVPNSEDDTYFDDWHVGQLVEKSTLEELSTVLAPWLKIINKQSSIPEISELTSPEKLIDNPDENNDIENDEEVTELVTSSAENNQETSFDFSKYLSHQGSVELALYMLDDYVQDNHQQLDVLVNAIKAKDFDKAKEAIINLQLNAKILVATDLEKLCSQWSKLLNGNDIPNSLNEVNILLKRTRAELTAVDSYAESI